MLPPGSKQNVPAVECAFHGNKVESRIFQASGKLPEVLRHRLKVCSVEMTTDDPQVLDRGVLASVEAHVWSSPAHVPNLTPDDTKSIPLVHAWAVGCDPP